MLRLLFLNLKKTHLVRYLFKIESTIKPFIPHHLMILNKNLIITTLANKERRTFKLGEMETVLENYKTLWSKSFRSENNTAEKRAEINSGKFIVLNKVKLLESFANDIEEFLWNEFKTCKENLFYFHLRLAEFCLYHNDLIHKESSVLFLNKTFEYWYRQYSRKDQTKVVPNEDGINLSNELFTIETYHILKAFDLATKNLNLLTSFNKIYKFDKNLDVLKMKIDDLAKKSNGLNLIKIISELKINDSYPVDWESILLPLMITDKYKQIEELINNNEKTLFVVVEVCDKVCNGAINFKKIADNYDCKRSNKFSGAKVAKFALSCLKKIKKSHLIYTTYPGLQFQLKLNQLRFLINTKYNQTDPMSFEGWSELVIDLVSESESLISQLFFEIIHYNKDVNVGLYFVEKFGPSYIQKLPPQTQEFYNRNAPLFESKYRQNIALTSAYSKDEFYRPRELKDENIVFVDDTSKFAEMLEFFETKKPDVVGLDCEWKPVFGNEETDMELNAEASVSANGDKNKRPNTLQIATREKTFIVEVKDLVDTLDDESLMKFGNLFLFSEDLIKLGYSFEQDASKLSHSFPKFKHKFCEFTHSVINMDEIASDVQRRYKLFDDETSTDPTATSAAVGSSVTTTTATPASSSNNGKPKGLSKLTQSCFGKALDKSECMSNWQNRPLRSNQLRYAALDAFVLIQIHDYILGKLKSQKIDYDYVNGRKSLF